MINNSNIFGDVTEYDRSLFVAALDHYESSFSKRFDTASQRTKEREKIKPIRIKLNTTIQKFSTDELVFFYDALRVYRDAFETYENVHASEEEKIRASLRKYIRRIDDLVTDLRT